jgi:hypothetical protein
MNPSAGSTIIGFLFLGGIVYGLLFSKRRLITLLYILVGLLVPILVGIVVALLSPEHSQAASGVGADLGATVAGLAGIIHANKTRRVSASG